MKFYSSKLQMKITLYVIITLALGFGLLVYMSTGKQAQEMESASFAQVDILSASLVSSMKNIMMTGKPEFVSSLLTDLRKVDGVEEIRLYNQSGQEVYANDVYGPAGPEKLEKVKSSIASGELAKLELHNSITIVKPLTAEERCNGCHPGAGKSLGVVTVSVSMKKAYADINNSRKWGVLNALAVMFGIWLLLAYEIEKIVLRPVRKSVIVMEKMENEKDLTYRMDYNSNDEIGRLGKEFNSFVESIQNVIQKINRVTYQVSSASTQIVVNSGRISEGAQIQARSVESTSGATEEMSASMKEIASSANILYESAEQSSSSIIQMTASIDQIAGSTSVLSSSVESTVSSITEISASIKEVSCSIGSLSEAVGIGVDTMAHITSLIEKVEQAARDSAGLTGTVAEQAKALGAGAMARAIDGMDKIKESVECSGELINKLGDRSKQIGEILDIIDEVADQTELLSLNAAILASQAGEHGKGFAVVAEEIKDLAERTVSSTNEIAKLVISVQAETQEAIEAMDGGRRAVVDGQAMIHEAKDVLTKIVESSIKSSVMSRKIASSTLEQSNGAAQVGDVMSNISIMVKQILRATQELTEGSEQILREADKIRDVAKQVSISTKEQAKGSETIIQAVESVHHQARQIASATKEHQKGSEDITKSIDRIREVAHENENLAGEMNHAVEDLAKHTEELKDKAMSFKVASADHDMIRLGIVPLESPAQMYKKFHPLADYLTKKIGREVVFKLTPTFSEAVADVGNGSADICYMTPTTYIEAHDHYGVELLAKAMRKGTPYSHTIIVARQDSNIDRLEDIKNKKFAFGDKMSTSSYVVPRAMLEKAGVRLADLIEYKFLGHHDDVAKAVLFGEYDAGGLRETTAYQYKDKGLKFIKISDAIPEFNLCSRPNLDAELARKIKAALLELDGKTPETARILKSIDKDYTGFMDARDQDYTSVRDMLKAIGGVKEEGI